LKMKDTKQPELNEDRERRERGWESGRLEGEDERLDSAEMIQLEWG
jgi:hypothetical protein